MTCTLDSGRQLALMLRTSAGHAAGKNLRSLGNVFLQAESIFIVDDLNFFSTESANLLFPMHRMEGARRIISFHECNTFLTH